MKASRRQALFFFTLLFVMNSCASNTEVVTESTTSTAATVPGEKIPGEASVTPGVGPGSPNASVHW
jgi:hypothetical protein